MQNAKGKMQNTGKILERNPPRVRDARGDERGGIILLKAHRHSRAGEVPSRGQADPRGERR